MHRVPSTESNQIRRLREEKGVKRVHMAAHFDVDQSTVYRWETVGPPTNQIRAIARFLEVTPAEVMGWEAAA